jgi:hypothetical protein
MWFKERRDKKRAAASAQSTSSLTAEPATS